MIERKRREAKKQKGRVVFLIYKTRCCYCTIYDTHGQQPKQWLYIQKESRDAHLLLA
jgi:hypothetical protein